MKATTKSLFCVLLALAITLCAFAAAFAAGGFSDVSETSWALQYISGARDAGIVNGYSDGTFRPNKDISRQETATMLYRTLKKCAEKAAAAGADPFDEADYSEEFAEQLAAAGSAKWASVYLAYGFKNGFLTAEDFPGADAAGTAQRRLIAMWTAKAMNYELAPVSVLPYSDTSHIAASDFKYIDALYRHSIMMGNADGTFAPDHSFIRAQMAAVAVRLMQEDLSAVGYDQLVAHRYGTLSTVNAERRTMALVCSDRTYTLRIDEKATVLLDGEQADFSALSALTGKKITVSGMAGTDTVIVQTAPRMLQGTVESLESKKGFTLVKINSSAGVTACYAAVDPAVISLLSAGRSINYISDGALLLETN